MDLAGIRPPVTPLCQGQLLLQDPPTFLSNFLYQPSLGEITGGYMLAALDRAFPPDCRRFDSPNDGSLARLGR